LEGEPAQRGQKKNTPSNIFYFHIIIYIVENKKWEHWDFQYHRNRTACCSSWRYMQAPAGFAGLFAAEKGSLLLGFLGASETWALKLNSQSRSK